MALSVPASFFTSHLINPVFIATSDTFGLSVSNAIHLSSCHQLYVGAGVPVALHQKSIHCSGPPTLMSLGWDIIVGGIGLTKWKMKKKKTVITKNQEFHTAKCFLLQIFASSASCHNFIFQTIDKVDWLMHQFLLSSKLL